MSHDMFSIMSFDIISQANMLIDLFFRAVVFGHIWFQRGGEMESSSARSGTMHRADDRTMPLASPPRCHEKTHRTIGEDSALWQETSDSRPSNQPERQRQSERGRHDSNSHMMHHEEARSIRVIRSAGK